MITFMDLKEELKDVEKCLDSQLWHACAGGIVQMPPVNSEVFYFPQGHAEHASGTVDFRVCRRIPPYLLCRVSAIKFMADPETDEVFAKIKLIPISNSEPGFDDDAIHNAEQGKPPSFAKTLTQSDANNGGGFSVPRYCAETIFPGLDYSADPPAQSILAKDVHGETWKFRHIYRGTPRRHLLTTGWSNFVNHKKLVAGDSIVFLRAKNGDLCVGIRRAKRGSGGGPEVSSGWFGNVHGSSSSNGNGGLMGKGKVRPESVIEAATHAANGQPFEAVFHPRAGTPEFCVKASMVKAALQIRWCSGMRFKMAFETEDASRISWFVGTISSVQVSDALYWPDSPWRLLQVIWDEPDLLQNVKNVSPWMVELASNMPAFNLSTFSPPRKKSRLAQHPDFLLDGQLPMAALPCNLLGQNSPFRCLPYNTPAGMQGARHAHYGLSLSDIHLNKLESGQFPAGFPPQDLAAPPTRAASNSPITQKPSMSDENVSCLLTIAHSTQNSKKSDHAKTPQFVLFGQPILTEQQISLSCSGDTVSSVLTGNGSSEGNLDKMSNFYPQETDPNLETGHCKVFMESKDVGRTLNLSLLCSYDELYKKLADMFGIENSETLSHVLYRDIAGAVKHIGDEPFSDFMKTSRRLTIVMD